MWLRDYGEAKKFDDELNSLDEQSKSFKIINQLNEESFAVFKTALSSTQSFDERISKLDIFIKKTKEHIQAITEENNDAESTEGEGSGTCRFYDDRTTYCYCWNHLNCSKASKYFPVW